MIRPERRNLERQRHWMGQKLKAADFRDWADNDAQLRWWHNRAIHDAFGIRRGLEVIIGQDTVTVTSGLGYDCFGRELVLTEDRNMTFPEKTGGAEIFALILRRRSPDISCFDDHSSDCYRMSESNVELLWKPLRMVDRGDGLFLGMVSLGDSTRKRQARSQRARPDARPRLAAGDTIPGNTPWEPWIIAGPRGQKTQVGIQTRVDTSSAGFINEPRYFATLNGPKWDSPGIGWLISLYTHVTETTPDGFLFRCLLLPIPASRELFENVMDISHVEQPRNQSLVISVADTGKLRAGEIVTLQKADGTLLTTERFLELNSISTGNKLEIAGKIPNIALAAKIKSTGIASNGKSVRLNAVDGLRHGHELSIVWLNPKTGAPEIATMGINTVEAKSNVVTLAGKLDGKQLGALSTAQPMVISNFAVPNENSMAAFTGDPNLYVSWIGCEEQLSGQCRSAEPEIVR